MAFTRRISTTPGDGSEGLDFVHVSSDKSVYNPWCGDDEEGKF
jgi:hypothetical protein